MGPGTAYLQQSCPESGFVLCDYKDRLPIDWRDFLFDESPEKGVFGAVPVETQLALADEQVAFVLQTLLLILCRPSSASCVTDGASFGLCRLTMCR